ncbi:hypothetical protein ACIBSV_50475 [Embleya sp. NPDC050154]|uniref:hypothetical protein n=1 Tax=unclassified Embleya TaxID=2699296 RepID=UPI0037A41F35
MRAPMLRRSSTVIIALARHAPAHPRPIPGRHRHRRRDRLRARRRGPHHHLARHCRHLHRTEAGDKNGREQAYLAEILRLPVVVRAPAAWWNAHRAAVVAVARREPTVSGGLLNVAPKWHQRDMTFDQARALGLV